MRVSGMARRSVVVSYQGQGSTLGRWPALLRVADDLDVVTVGVEDEGAVVRRVVLRAEPGRAMIAKPSRECRTVKGVDLGPLRRALEVISQQWDQALGRLKAVVEQ